MRTLKWPKKVWNRVGIIAENKYSLLKQDKQEKRKVEEKSDLNFVDSNVGTPCVKMSGNKDKRSMFKDGTMDNDQVEG